MDKFDRIEENVIELNSHLEQRGLAPAGDMLTRHFLEDHQVEYLDDDVLGKDWEITCETQLISFDLADLAITVRKEKLSETPFRRDMLEALAQPECYLGWNDLVNAACEKAQSEDLQNLEIEAWWGVAVSHHDGGISVNECWAPDDFAMRKKLIREMPLEDFLKKDIAKKASKTAVMKP